MRRRVLSDARNAYLDSAYFSGTTKKRSAFFDLLVFRRYKTKHVGIHIPTFSSVYKKTAPHVGIHIPTFSSVYKKTAPYVGIHIPTRFVYLESCLKQDKTAIPIDFSTDMAVD